MSYTGDRTQLGIWVLQDHRRDLEPSRRLALAGARVVDATEDEWQGFVYDTGKNEQGTVGDIHPWTHWEATDRRGAGAWQSVFASVVDGVTAKAGGKSGLVNIRQADGSTRAVPGSTTTPQTGENRVDVLPMRNADYEVDPRFERKQIARFDWEQIQPVGTRGIVLSGTKESSQEEVFLPADGRIVVPQRFGPDQTGTLFSDLVTDETLGDGPGRYGVSRVDAPAQSLHFVVRFKANDRLKSEEGNAVALNALRSQQGRMAGFVPFVGKLDTTTVTPGSGQDDPVITPRDGDPSNAGGDESFGPISETPRDAAQRVGEANELGIAFAPGNAVPPGARDGGRGGGGSGHASLQMERNIGVGLMSHDAGGPWIVGHQKDKHRHDDTKDTGPRNSAHFHTDSLWYRNQEEDAPHEHNIGVYPRPNKVGYPWVVEMLYDPLEPHTWMDGQQPGLWRRVAWVPLSGGGDDDDDDDTGDPPGDDVPVTPPADDPRPPPPVTPPGTPDVPSTPSQPTPTFPTPSQPGPDDGRGPQGWDNPWGRPPWAPPDPLAGSRTIRPVDHTDTFRRRVIDAPMVMAFGATLQRGTGWNLGTPDLRTRTAPASTARRLLDWQPAIYRTEGMAPQEDDNSFKYTERPPASAVVGGVAASGAGVWSFPATYRIEDYRDGAPPTLTYPQTYRGYADGVALAFGKPSASQGVQDGGFRIIEASSGVKLQTISSGTWGTFTPTDNDHLVTKAYADSVGGSSPLTTKGDLYGYDSADARVPVGADNTVLTADSSDAQGVSYKTVGALLDTIGSTTGSMLRREAGGWAVSNGSEGQVPLVDGAGIAEFTTLAAGEYPCEPVCGTAQGGATLPMDIINWSEPSSWPGEPYVSCAGNGSGSQKYSGIWRFQIPPHYVPGTSTLSIRVRLKEETAALTDTKVDVTAHEEGAGADICATAEVTGITTSVSENDFSITDTSLVAGDTLLFTVDITVDDTAGGGPPGEARLYNVTAVIT